MLIAIIIKIILIFSNNRENILRGRIEASDLEAESDRLKIIHSEENVSKVKILKNLKSFRQVHI